MRREGVSREGVWKQDTGDGDVRETSGNPPGGAGKRRRKVCTTTADERWRGAVERSGDVA